MTTDAASPCVSVVIPTYRRPGRVVTAISAVLEQSWTDWELLIVDDNGEGSPEQLQTAAVVNDYLGDQRIRYLVHTANQGAPAARNTGIAAAAGRFLACLDDDDQWPADRLQILVNRFNTVASDCVMVYGTTLFVDDQGRERNRMTPTHEGHVFSRLMHSNFIGGTGSMMASLPAVRAVDGFDPEMPAMQDVDLFLRLCRAGSIATVGAVVLIMVEHEDGRITADHAARSTAWARRLTKYQDDYAADRKLLARGHEKYGRELVKAGDYAMARQQFQRAIRIRGPVPGLLFRYLRAWRNQRRR